ncbi:virion core protein P4a [Turkeypox virus]|uniref:Virion core protein P4a n=1 Tax=Turkeypox virus TaxID=336486 RepID=A0A0M3ZPP0_9POXV|nr:virion core protein P4a [Turkeypox virus]ALA62502.1 virion core protein P4a [Turkeypox virus]
MMLINNIVTLDQLESPDYLYKLLSTVLPSLCLDYKVDPRFIHGYVHGLDTIHMPALKAIVTKEDGIHQLDTIGINYLFSRTNELANYFPVILDGGNIKSAWIRKSDDLSNPIPCTLSFNDLPYFTKLVVKIRTTSFEGHARYFGGYVKYPGSPDILSPINLPNISFSNSYIHSLTYPHTIGGRYSSYKALLINGVMHKKDLVNLLNIRSLLSPISRNMFDTVYRIDYHANANNVTYNPNSNTVIDLANMRFKYLVMYLQHFTRYALGDIYIAGVQVVISMQMLASFVISAYYQKEIKYIDDNKLFNLQFSNQFSFRPINYNNYITYTAQQLNMRLLNLASVNFNYIINLLNIIAKNMTRPQNIPKNASLFWDGISYDEYKNLKFVDMMFLGSSCYLFALYNKNNITFCSMLTDVLRVGETPLRVCFLPRIIKNKTIPALIEEILDNINKITIRDFPRYDTNDVKHIGLSDSSFMLFFQLLRLMENKEPHVAIKETLMAYTGIKMDDNGPPYYITPESHRTFVFLLFRAMGFNIRVNRNIVSSHNYTSYTITPRVTKRYLISMLQKASCSPSEAEKLLSSAYDLVSFMIGVNSSSNRDSYRRMNKYFYGGYKEESKDEEPTLVQFISPVNILDRINIKGILSATTLNEILDTDVFLPENIHFKNNLVQLLQQEDSIDGKTIAHIMPLNMLDKLLLSKADGEFMAESAAGAKVSVSGLLDGLDESVPNENETNEVIDLITDALKDSTVKDSTCIATNILNSLIPISEKQMDGVKKMTCHGTLMFKELAMHIYFIERYFKGKISDDVKISILEKYRDFIDLSKSLYRDLIAIDQIKSVLSIIHRTGRTVDDTPITQEDIQRAYDIAKPKIRTLTNYYNEMTKTYFQNMKKIMNPDDSDAVGF